MRLTINIHNSSLLAVIEGGVANPCGVGMGADGGVITVSGGGGTVVVMVVVNGCVVCRIDLLPLSFCNISCN